MFKRKNNHKEDLGVTGKIIVGLLLGLLILFGIALFMAVSFFAFAGLFMVLGVEYQSLKSLIVFLVLFFGVGVAFELVFKGLFFFITAFINRYRIMLYILTDCIAGWLAIFTVDELVSGITISVSQEMIMVETLSLIEFSFEGKKEGAD